METIDELLKLETGRLPVPSTRTFAPKQPSSTPDPATIAEIRRYLENPTRSGIWQFEAKWERDSGISTYLWSELEKKFEGEEVIQITSGGSKIPLQLTDKQKEEFRDRVQMRASFQTSLFTHLCHINGVATKIPEYESTDKVLFDLLDLDQLQKRFADAYDYFKNEIYFEGFNPFILGF